MCLVGSNTVFPFLAMKIMMSELRPQILGREEFCFWLSESETPVVFQLPCVRLVRERPLQPSSKHKPLPCD